MRLDVGGPPLRCCWRCGLPRPLRAEPRARKPCGCHTTRAVHLRLPRDRLSIDTGRPSQYGNGMPSLMRRSRAGTRRRPACAGCGSAAFRPSGSRRLPSAQRPSACSRRTPISFLASRGPPRRTCPQAVQASPVSPPVSPLASRRGSRVVSSMEAGRKSPPPTTAVRASTRTVPRAPSPARVMRLGRSPGRRRRMAAATRASLLRPLPIRPRTPQRIRTRHPRRTPRPASGAEPRV